LYTGSIILQQVVNLKSSTTDHFCNQGYSIYFLGENQYGWSWMLERVSKVVPAVSHALADIGGKVSMKSCFSTTGIST